MKDKYIHLNEVHNTRAACEIVPFLLDIFEVKSVIDIGCGTGTWLKIFKEHGVKEIVGVDGDYLDKSQLEVPKSVFYAKNLEESLGINKKYDMALSLEVAEHLSHQVANQFVNDLCSLSDIIVFSAAVPHQGGQNHINEQSTSYWIAKFEKNGFQLHDIIRPKFWNNNNVDWWYKQNVLIFSKVEFYNEKLRKYPSFYGNELIHPTLFKNRTHESANRYAEIKSIKSGGKSLKVYIKLLLEYLSKQIKR